MTGREAIGTSGADGPYRLVDLSVYRLGAQDALGHLRSYAADGHLEPGTAQSLLAKVGAASVAAERGQPKTTANQLTAFVRELEALPSDKLSEQTRAALIKAARRLGGR